MSAFNSLHKPVIDRLFYTANSKCGTIILCLCCQFTMVANAQDSLKTNPAHLYDTTITTKTLQDSSTVVNIIPAAFPGGQKEWVRYLITNLVVPEDMRGAKFSRIILVKFTVDEKGRLKNFEDAGKDPLKKEAIRVVKSSGKWIPAYANSKPIASTCERTINFQWN